MMPVADIERRQGVDRARQRGDDGIVRYHPELMADAILGRDIHVRRIGAHLGEDGIDFRGGGIGHHDGPGLRIHRFDLTHAVVFLGGRRVLVLADAVRRIVRERSDRGESGLSASAVTQPVNVISGLGIADQHTCRDHAGEVLGGLRIDGLIVRIDRWIEIDLRLGDVQEAPRPSLGALACLCARKHVIRRCQNFPGAPGCRTQRTKRLYQSQRALRMRMDGGPV